MDRNYGTIKRAVRKGCLSSLDVLQAVPAVCALLSLAPLLLVCTLDLDKLHRWKLQQQNLQQGSCALDEPLLVDEAADHKGEEAAAPFTVPQKDSRCVDDSALHRAGSSSRAEI